ncbi:hypothetical protein, partial [Vreelandella alkaliphila]|uniref:hypothetical protein n=1 Tax=Vreelandella alkaliphila TaxID=272774 RepID=UPI001E5F9467
SGTPPGSSSGTYLTRNPANRLGFLFARKKSTLLPLSQNGHLPVISELPHRHSREGLSGIHLDLGL